MDELLAVAEEIRDLLANLNDKISNLTGGGAYSISDIIDEVNSIKGALGYDLSDIHEKLESVETEVENIKGGLFNLSDIYDKVDSINTYLFMKD